MGNSKQRSNKKFDIADPSTQIEGYLNEATRYRLGEIGFSFYQIKKMNPVFAFDYISFNGDEKCFNNPKFSTDDYVGLLDGLKKVSGFTYEKLHDIPNFRFHKIDFNDSRVSINKWDFKCILTNKPDSLSDEELPNLWQFDLQYLAKARVAGFLYKGIFYLVWYDRNHTIYP